MTSQGDQSGGKPGGQQIVVDGAGLCWTVLVCAGLCWVVLDCSGN